ncbi:putative membrane protein YeiB [Nocardiopsis mwathae]|uniref:Putative membrane protein YeiB n=1 Tax=Nocardiopsis mwathae TaxID=1472723 RepID=A0A7W9YN54_9ACTN|nr:DUF418 domain-containing protein [Nocardiopsis mwathae]MBB6174146.1 putative membrane protein YeiB [Nocardiopsis mwathae]
MRRSTDPADQRRHPARGPARGSVRAGERALAPDLGRGTMLLLIALSNTAFHLWAAEHGPSGWHPIDGSAVDRAVQFAMITALDLRTYPLFAFLFGYGMMSLYMRQTEAGASPRAGVALLRRRSLLLLAFGLAHAALLMAGDIIGAYGLSSLILGWLFLRRGQRTLLAWSGVGAAILLWSAVPAFTALATGDLGRIGAPATEAATAAYAAGETDPVAAAATRLQTWAFVTLGGGLLAFGSHALMLLGFWAARRRILEEPHRHLRLIGWTAAIGLTIGWSGGLLSALAHVGAIDVPPNAVGEEGALSRIQEVTGVPGGLGYVAVFALLAHWLRTRSRGGGHGVAVQAVAAVGKRSLSSYMAHSLMFSPLLAAWGLGLGATMGSAGMAAFAIGVWLVTVVGAYALERQGRPGPAEALLRRLMYGRPPEQRQSRGESQ